MELGMNKQPLLEEKTNQDQTKKLVVYVHPISIVSANTQVNDVLTEDASTHDMEAHMDDPDMKLKAVSDQINDAKVKSVGIQTNDPTDAQLVGQSTSAQA